MEPRDKAHQVGECLDSALKRYGEAEPRAGLEGRILANVRSVAPAFSRLPGVVAVAAMLLVLGVVLLRSHSRDREKTAVMQEPVNQTQASSPTEVVRPQTPALPRPIKHFKHKPPAMQAAAPKLDQFPAPLSPSEQDKPLLAYLRRASRVKAAQARTGGRTLAGVKPEDMAVLSWTPARVPTFDLNSGPSPRDDEFAGLKLVIKN